MTRDPVFGRSAMATLLSLCMALGPAAPLLTAQTGSAPPPGAAKPSPAPPAKTPAPGKTAAPANAAAPAAKTAAPGTAGPPAPPDGGWPRAYTTASGGNIIVYQPQMASWDQQKHMVAYSAVSYTAKGAPKAALGSVKLEADTKVSTAERLVKFTDLKMSESNFPSLDKDQTREVVAEIDKAMPDNERVIGLDRVLASVDRSQIMPKNIEGV